MILSLAPDLMIRSRIDVAARHYGVAARHVTTGEEFLAALAEPGDPWRLVLLDVDMPGIDGPALIAAARAATSARVVGSCSHVETDLIRSARAAGAHSVMANSTFTAAIPGLVAPLADAATLGIQ
mgnify:CR=1 FL=1